MKSRFYTLFFSLMTLILCASGLKAQQENPPCDDCLDLEFTIAPGECVEVTAELFWADCPTEPSPPSFFGPVGDAPDIMPDGTVLCPEATVSYDYHFILEDESICVATLTITVEQECVPDPQCPQPNSNILEFGDAAGCLEVFGAFIQSDCGSYEVLPGQQYRLCECTSSPENCYTEGGECFELDGDVLVINGSNAVLVYFFEDESSVTCELFCEPEEICKIEDHDIGVEGLTIYANGVYITFVNWIPKEDSPGEYIGFEIETSGPVEYIVKAGKDLFFDNTNTWINPNGTSGPKAKGISYIDFCPPEETSDSPGNSGKPKGKGKRAPGIVTSGLTIFPNPVTTRATMSFVLESTSDVAISILNTNGMVVRNVVNGTYAEGTHMQDVDLSDLTPGMYLVNLRSGNMNVTQKVIVME